MNRKLLKSICLMLALIMAVFCFAGCIGSDDPEQTSAPSKQPTAKSGKATIVFRKDAPMIDSLKASDGCVLAKNVALAVPEAVEFMLPADFDMSLGEDIPDGAQLEAVEKKVDLTFVSSERISDVLKVTYEDAELGVRVNAYVRCYTEYDGAFELSLEIENTSKYDFSFSQDKLFTLKVNGAEAVSAIRYRHEIIADENGNNVLNLTKKYIAKNVTVDVSFSEKKHQESPFVPAIECRKGDTYGVIWALEENVEGTVFAKVLEDGIELSAENRIPAEEQEDIKFTLAGGEKMSFPSVYTFVYSEGFTKGAKKFEKWLGEVKFPAEESGAELIFSDNFDAEELDETIWTALDGEIKAESSGWSKNAVSVENGVLKLGAFVNEETGLLELGGVTTEDKAKFGMGYYEASIRFPAVETARGAFRIRLGNYTTSEADGTGVDEATLDVVEATTASLKNTVYWDINTDQCTCVSSKYDDLDIYDGEFHRFAIWRTETAYIFCIDGAKLWETDGAGICLEDGIMMLSLEADAKESLEAEKAEMEVDYIRIWNTNPYEALKQAE